MMNIDFYLFREIEKYKSNFKENEKWQFYRQ